MPLVAVGTVMLELEAIWISRSGPGMVDRLPMGMAEVGREEVGSRRSSKI